MAARIRSVGVAFEGSSDLYTAYVRITPRRFDFSRRKGAVKTPVPDSLARKIFSRSSCMYRDLY